MADGEMPVVDASTTVGEEDRDALPVLFRLAMQEIRDDLKAIRNQLGALSRIEAMFDELATRTQTVEKRMNRTDDTLDDHEKRLAALEAAQRKDTGT